MGQERNSLMSATIINPAESFIGTASSRAIMALVKDLRQDGRVWEDLSIDQYLEDIDEWIDEHIIFLYLVALLYTSCFAHSTHFTHFTCVP